MKKVLPFCLLLFSLTISAQSKKIIIKTFSHVYVDGKVLPVKATVWFDNNSIKVTSKSRELRAQLYERDLDSPITYGKSIDGYGFECTEYFIINTKIKVKILKYNDEKFGIRIVETNDEKEKITDLQ